ncbi:Putative ketoacyl reductase [Legionella massiliensis]|uniref:Putative ketoacyl reductase n=1 Tax=Legionella massiliensis TaxID=1034943 RepID=A0A078KVK7_9GAMM|nr:SDR family oxidoreductase [Legionella massiliensis]CDZ78445.1 Putative ketoacyl reductase [Legionella massiliensis]CEE14183.1 Putative ketoacyl reductase [Legionella massiliensis]
MNLQLDNKLALVTASTGGIGFEIARSLAQENAIVIVNGRTEENVSKAISQLKTAVPNGKFERLVADNSVLEGSKLAIAIYPEIDILVNNLGIYEAVGFFDETDEDWQRLFEVNVMSGVRLSRHYLKKMLEKNTGRILFVSSESGITPAPEMAHYSATKTMQLSISRSLAELTKGTEVTVNTILPGPTKTPGVEKFVKDIFPELSFKEAEKRFVKENRPSSLLERLIEPSEIANLTTFLCSPLASAINGAAIRTEGGVIRSI